MKTSSPQSDRDYLYLGPTTSLKWLEHPFAYKKDTDELYELGEEAFALLALCDGTRSVAELEPDEEWLAYCLEEGLLELSPTPHPLDRERLTSLQAAMALVGDLEAAGAHERGEALPSLRYLTVDITNRCNLACRHCYLGPARPLDLDPGLFGRLASEFEEAGGLRLIVSGGEPLLAPSFWEINEIVASPFYRSILSSNATTIDDSVARRLRFDNVQVSLDGMRAGHDAVRGRGSFERVRRGMEALAGAGVGLSVATMVHSRNLGEFDAMAELISAYPISAWTIDVPVAAGRMRASADLAPPLPEAAARLSYQFGSEVHESSGEWACGAHLGAVLADGTFAKCGFYSNWSSGRATEGLWAAWRSLPRLALSDLDCDCDRLDDCRGGCRFRAELMAGDRRAPDPVGCAAHGLPVCG
ncbi:MAG: radical SAM protein [Actinobacteria bacterium]|nr:MAG: radical SAM protein [Actinomycetota bacterium]